MSQITSARLYSRPPEEESTLHKLQYGKDIHYTTIGATIHSTTEFSSLNLQQSSTTLDKNAVIAAATDTPLADKTYKNEPAHAFKVFAPLPKVNTGKVSVTETSQSTCAYERLKAIAQKVLFQSEDAQSPDYACSTQYNSNADTDDETTAFIWPTRMPLVSQPLPEEMQQDDLDKLTYEVKIHEITSDIFHINSLNNGNNSLDSSIFSPFSLNQDDLLEDNPSDPKNYFSHKEEYISSIQKSLIMKACESTSRSIDKDSPIFTKIVTKKLPINQ